MARHGRRQKTLERLASYQPHIAIFLSSIEDGSLFTTAHFLRAMKEMGVNVHPSDTPYAIKCHPQITLVSRGKFMKTVVKKDVLNGSYDLTEHIKNT